MNTKKQCILKILAHVSIIISGMFLTFFVIDRINPFMEFLSSEMTAWLILAFAIIVLTESIMLIVTIRKHEKSRQSNEPTEYDPTEQGLSHEERERARAELERLKAEADREFMEMLRQEADKRREERK